MRTVLRIIHCARGANAIEYALVASLIAIAAFAAFESLGNKRSRALTLGDIARIKFPLRPFEPGHQAR